MFDHQTMFDGVRQAIPVCSELNVEELVYFDSNKPRGFRFLSRRVQLEQTSEVTVLLVLRAFLA